MFSFFKKKATAPAMQPIEATAIVADVPPAEAAVAAPLPPALVPQVSEAAVGPAPSPALSPARPPIEPAAGWWKSAVGKLTGSTPFVAPPATATPAATTPALAAAEPPAVVETAVAPQASAVPWSEAVATPPPSPSATRQSWLDKLRNGLRKTGSSIAQVFTGTQIDEALYEELEAALLMADAGVKATEFLLADLKRRLKDSKATDPAVVKALLSDALTELLAPLEKSLEIGRHKPLVMMVVGVNGAGKTTSIGKLTRHLADADQTVLLAAADTFRAAAREQLAVWAERNDERASALGNRVEIVSQEGADPAAVAFDAVSAGKARGRDVVIADTAGRLPTQLHLMEELKKIKRVIGKAEAGAPHEVLLVVDGNTGQNALTQVKAFDDALGLSGLVITKLDGTAKGGVLAAIARERPVPVYFIGVGEKLEDLQTFNAREFAQALLA
jgi:fused signal recognition particle receptor